MKVYEKQRIWSRLGQDYGILLNVMASFLLKKWFLFSENRNRFGLYGSINVAPVFKLCAYVYDVNRISKMR